MKKLAFFPVAALLLLASCSDDTPNPTIPDNPVKVQEAVADHPTLDVPAQKSNSYELDESLYRFSYANGQTVTYQMLTAGEVRIAIVKKIGGTASKVTIPYKVTADLASGGVGEWYVYGIDLYYDSVAENVTELVLPYTCAMYNKQNTYVYVGDEQIRKMIQYAPSLKKVELEEGFPGYVSVNGAIYNTNMTKLVAVPRATAGEFTVVEDATEVGDFAFSGCAELEVITLPAAVAAIGEQAMAGCGKLVVVNILADEAPTAYAATFANFLCEYGVLRVKKGTLASYNVNQPTLALPEAPVEPEFPADDATDEEWDAYDAAYDEYTAAMEQYESDKEAYDAAWTAYDEKAGYKAIKTIQEKTF